MLEGTTASPEQVNEAVRINTSSRLFALKVSFLVMAGLALIGYILARDLPKTTAGAAGTAQPEEALEEVEVG